ncbi:MAG: hypothetical protein IIC71_13060 [Acidobacteria bacterium]|nr:hypothetical protein [Acidobacteriota bacterium]
MNKTVWAAAFLLVVGACSGITDTSVDPTQAPSTTTVAVHQLRPEPGSLVWGGTLDPGVEYQYSIYAHCGVAVLGSFNDVLWQADVPDTTLDFIPAAWKAVIVGDQTVTVTLVLTEDLEPNITATVNGTAVVYRPSSKGWPACD